MKKSVCSVFAFLILLSVVGFSGCGSGNGTWVNTGGGISSSWISSLAYDSQHGVLFAGVSRTRSSVNQAPVSIGVWKHQGSTWTSMGGAVASFGIYSLAYDPTHNLLYAGTFKLDGGNNGVWKYDGTTWTNTGGELSNDALPCLLYDSAHNVLYGGTYGGTGVWKYDGSNWVNTGGAVSGYQIASLAYDSAHNTLFAGTDHQGVWKYDGTTWTSTKGAVSDYRIDSLAYDSNHRAIYAGTESNGVWKYDGSTWTNTNGALSHYWIVSLTYDSKHNMLYAGINYSLNKGVSPKGSTGVWKYDGHTWTNMGGQVSDYAVHSLAYYSAHNVLYAGTDRYGVWSH